jgi:uncharacterized protein (TIGR02687 family)
LPQPEERAQGDGIMNDRIAQALGKLFERSRIVFWYDEKRELRSDFEALALPDVEKIELAGNEFAVKYRILREQPKSRFLIYREGPRPDDLENWLLDVELAHAEFRTDQAAIWLSELGLGAEFSEVVRFHPEFFQAAKRKEALKKLLEQDDTIGRIRLKTLAVCAGSDPRVDSVAEQLLQELADGRDEKLRLIGRCALDGFLWEQMSRSYGYRSAEPGIRDFVLELFKSCYAMGTDGEVKLTADALVFLKRWKDSRQFEESFQALSAECAEILGIEQDLSKRDFRDLIDLDYFKLIDQKIISDLVRETASRTVSAGDVTLWVRRRRQGRWYTEYSHLYEAIEYAARFLHALDEANLSMESLADGLQRYCSSWYRIDQLYRKFTYHVRMSGQATLTGTLSERIENLYSNSYLLKLGDAFQGFVEAASRWEAFPLHTQKEFFEQRVRPFLRKENKVCVIVSDALRFEIADELLGLIRQEDRYTAELEPALSMLPSYTQLGMAALLPNAGLAIAEDESAAVFVDGQDSRGTENRIKILSNANGMRATACKADELMAMKGDDCRALVREHDVLFVYHNRIDAVGDKRESEERVFEAVEESLHEIVRLIKKLTGANVNNILVTSDHGFIYQNRAIEESDFSGCEVKGEQILYRDRRFVLGKGLAASPGLHTFTSARLGLSGGVEVQIPKSINRLRLKGSGSRYVHGGATLQEVVLPVLRINKKRASDLSSVEVDIVRGGSAIITSGQLAVTLYQKEPATEKVQPRHLRAGIFTESGDLISDSHELSFDLASENPRERELQVRFLLTRKADEANGRDVYLRLEEKVPGTSYFKEYKSLRYTMRRSFTSDFDF